MHEFIWMNLGHLQSALNCREILLLLYRLYLQLRHLDLVDPANSNHSEFEIPLETSHDDLLRRNINPVFYIPIYLFHYVQRQAFHIRHRIIDQVILQEHDAN